MFKTKTSAFWLVVSALAVKLFKRDSILAVVDHLSLRQWENYMVSSIPKFPTNGAKKKVNVKEFRILDKDGRKVGLSCPGCGHMGPMPERCAMFRCPECKIDMYLSGWCVFIWS